MYQRLYSPIHEKIMVILKYSIQQFEITEIPQLPHNVDTLTVMLTVDHLSKAKIKKYITYNLSNKLEVCNHTSD